VTESKVTLFDLSSFSLLQRHDTLLSTTNNVVDDSFIQCLPSRKLVLTPDFPQKFIPFPASMYKNQCSMMIRARTKVDLLWKRIIWMYTFIYRRKYITPVQDDKHSLNSFSFQYTR